MAVYTTLSESQVNDMLVHFSLAPLASLKAASDGIENTTYFLTLTNQRQLVLTLFESLTSTDLQPYLELLEFYSKHHLPVPAPLRDMSGHVLQRLAGKPAVLLPRAPGKHCHRPEPEQCRQLGTALAELHNTAVGFPAQIPNPCGAGWAETTLTQLEPFLALEDQQLIRAQIAHARSLQRKPLPRGIIHGDLFRDNVLFDSGRITAFIDFYNAGHDFFLLDLAIAINDWCFDPSGAPLPAHWNALRDGYESLRPLSPAEQQAWPELLRWAATRFWLSRLKSRYLTDFRPPQAQQKDPLEYRSRLVFHLDNPPK